MAEYWSRHRFKSSGMLHNVRWRTVTDSAKHHIAFIFRLRSSNGSVCILDYAENEGTMILTSTCDCVTAATVQGTARLESSATLLPQPQITHRRLCVEFINMYMTFITSVLLVILL